MAVIVQQRGGADAYAAEQASRRWWDRAVGWSVSMALHVAAQAQRTGGIAAIVDAEHALNPGWARKCGVDLEKLLVEARQEAQTIFPANNVEERQA